MSAIHHANKKKIFIPNMCKICLEITNILWFFFIAERVTITSNYKHTCSINNYKTSTHKKKSYSEKR